MTHNKQTRQHALIFPPA